MKLQDQPLAALAAELQRHGNLQYNKAFQDHAGDLFVADIALKAGKKLHLAAHALQTAAKAEQKYKQAAPGPPAPSPGP